MKLKHKIILSIFVFVILVVSTKAFASTSNGTISDTDRYAWGENVGFIDFGSEVGDVHITDIALTGYAYGENIGWINLSGVVNDKEGHLSGYAWGENVGFIDFSQVEIDNHGYFTGSAYGENIGFILFNKDDTNIVTTDWRPKSSRSSGGSSSSGSSPQVIAKFNQEQAEKAEATGQTLPQTNTTLNLTRTLKYGMSGDDVRQLQIYLNTHNYTLTTTGPGSPNNETTYFGLKTKQAVIKFQLDHQLVTDGIVGPITRAKMTQS